MVAYNSVILIGNLTRDPEIRYTPNGTAVSDLSIAINEKIKDKENTIFVDVTVWDKQAENCCKYLAKGSGVLIDGRLAVDTWDDKQTGKKRTKLKVVASAVQFIGGKETKKQGEETKEIETEVEPENNIEDDDIPF
jgi:single-strand DNA-binding protein